MWSQIQGACYHWRMLTEFEKKLGLGYIGYYIMDFSLLYWCLWVMIILCMRPANERRRYNVTSSLIGWPHTQNDPCVGYVRHRHATIYVHGMIEIITETMELSGGKIHQLHVRRVLYILQHPLLYLICDDIMTWKCFLHFWPFVWGIHLYLWCHSCNKWIFFIHYQLP